MMPDGHRQVPERRRVRGARVTLLSWALGLAAAIAVLLLVCWLV